MNELLEGLKERVSNFSITALVPAQRYLLDTAWNAEEGFIDEESADFFEQILSVAEEFVERGDKTGIPHYVLFWSAIVIGSDAERQGNEELQRDCLELADKYIHESVDLGLNLAYFELGSYLFHGNGIWDKDEDKGIELMRRATELPILPELGYEPEFISKIIKDGYNECLANYSVKTPNEEIPDESSTLVTTQKKKKLKIRKQFTAKYYLACLAAIIGYILVSILIRNEFGLKSAYDISISNNPLLGIGVTLILNYSVIPLLMMAYFYKKNNGKHSVLLDGMYIAFLALCFADGVVPYINSSTNLLNLLLYPAIFLVAHRLLSLLIYAIISGKEDESDYKIYFGLALFAPFMAWILVIGIFFWIFQAFSSDYSPSQSYEERRSEDIKDSVRRELSAGVRTSGIYYDDGWKVVDYWNNSSTLSEISGVKWGYTYFEDSGGKIYVLSTNCPDKETVYYFN